MKSLSSKKKLLTINFWNCGITDEGVCTIFSSDCHWPALEKMHLLSNTIEENGCPPDPTPLTDAAVDALTLAMTDKMPALKKLNLCNNKMTSAGKEKLKAVAKPRNIDLWEGNWRSPVQM